MAGLGKRLVPLLDRILVERFVPEAKTRGGIMIPEKAQAKVQSATVIAVGTGARTEVSCPLGPPSARALGGASIRPFPQAGQTIPPAVKAGDKVLLPEYGGTKVEIDNKEFYIFRDSDVLGKWSD
ncbi:10 kDa heat shock protein, mitochondrial isoform X1 [Ixodes scapularis]|uniref:10 kDa heat shock protein, mitochondrial isoform X1 n=1 Tax=Ixodes scapularis TaxID=6945 RepID=UPI001C390AE0|nr:10 kDa heat shock protein, mitochondrial isoform X1 [Ixodes scapularis]